MFFSEDHIWVRIQDSLQNLQKEEMQVVVGISAYSQKQIGDIVHIALPTVGEEIEQGEVIVVLESTKAAIDVTSPLSGRVIESNSALLISPSPLNVDPEGEGWLLKLSLFSPQEIQNLLDEPTYRSQIDKHLS